MKLVTRFAVIIAAASLFATEPSEAKPLRVMTMNTMCDFCGDEKKFGSFDERIAAMADTINRHSPDLISLQEVRTEGQVNRIRSGVKTEYIPIFAEGYGLSYTDATLLIRKDRFKVVESGGLWLGPSAPDFSFGWRFSYPRRMEWAVVEELETREQFKFVGSHFDNATVNREATALLLGRLFKDSKIPVIFAGDTNLRPALPGYGVLLENFRDTFQEVKEHKYIANGPTVESDGCNIKKGADFPLCRVDHILLTKNSKWKTKSWQVDTFKYNGTSGFYSDHRAVVVELE